MLDSPVTLLSRRRYRALCAMLAFSVWLASSFAVIAGVHEAMHALEGDSPIQAEASDHVKSDHVKRSSAGDQQPATQGSALHALAHAGHCCDHTFASPPDALDHSPRLAPAEPPHTYRRLPRTAPTDRLIRPPIPG